MINSSDKACKGIILNQALPSLHGGSLEITLTVPLIVIMDEFSEASKNIIWTFLTKNWNT